MLFLCIYLDFGVLIYKGFEFLFFSFFFFLGAKLYMGQRMGWDF